MRQLSDNPLTVESFLTVLGPGNWGGPATRSPVTPQEDDTLLTRYLSELHFFCHLSNDCLTLL